MCKWNQFHFKGYVSLWCLLTLHVFIICGKSCPRTNALIFITNNSDRFLNIFFLYTFYISGYLKTRCFSSIFIYALYLVAYRKQRNKSISIWGVLFWYFSDTCLAENETWTLLITAFEFTVLCDISQSGPPGNTDWSAWLLWAKTVAARNIKYVSVSCICGVWTNLFSCLSCQLT